MGYSILAMGVRVSPIYFPWSVHTSQRKHSKEYNPNYFNMLRMYFSDSVELRWILGGNDEQSKSSLNSMDLLKAILMEFVLHKEF
jgi:hypothetical protein